MSLKNIKQDIRQMTPWEEYLRASQDGWGHFVGVDMATEQDFTVASMPCGNCGTYRKIDDHFVLEKCPNCGDDETDLSAPSIYDSDVIFVSCPGCGKDRAMKGTNLETCRNCGDEKIDFLEGLTKDRDSSEHKGTDQDSKINPVSGSI